MIVTSGAIGSPKLLLQSGIGPADELKAVGVAPVHDLPGVGRNLHDHLDLFTIAECSGPHSYDAYAKPHLALWAGLQYFMFKRGPAASSLFETGAFWYSDKTAALPDIQFHFGLGSGIEAGVAKMPNGGITLNAAYMRPKSRGSVRLRSANPADAPLIDPNYWQEPEDLRRGIMGVRIARDILRQPALKPFLAGERIPGPAVNTDQELFEHLSLNAKTQHHPVGQLQDGDRRYGRGRHGPQGPWPRRASHLRFLCHAEHLLIEYKRRHDHDRRACRRHYQGKPPEFGKRLSAADLPGFVYVIGSATSSGPRTYVGWSSDPQRRLEQHNSGAGAKSTRGRQWQLLYVERLETRTAAMSREWHLKRNRQFRKELAEALAR